MTCENCGASVERGTSHAFGGPLAPTPGRCLVTPIDEPRVYRGTIGLPAPSALALTSPDREVRRKARKAFMDEAKRLLVDMAHLARTDAEDEARRVAK